MPSQRGDDPYNQELHDFLNRAEDEVTEDDIVSRFWPPIADPDDAARAAMRVVADYNEMSRGERNQLRLRRV